jgi:hypothetical protein
LRASLRWRRALGPLVTLFLLLTAPAAVAAPSAGAAGVWALRSDGTILFTIALARTPRGWVGTWVRPEHFSFDGNRFSGFRGPAITRRSSAARELGGGAVALTFDDPSPGASPDRITIRPLGPGAAELAWDEVLDQVLLARVASARVAPPTARAGRAYPVPFNRPTNAEMTALFDADQAARADPAHIDWTKLNAEDSARRARARALLEAHALQSGDDFWHAAFLFQHGDSPADYLLAHSLAIIAAARGRADATWIAAATLDRYLQAIGQKQIYGTQYQMRQGQPATQEPYDRTLVSDALRAAMRVPSQAEQEKRRAQFDAEARHR